MKKKKSGKSNRSEKKMGVAEKKRLWGRLGGRDLTVTLELRPVAISYLDGGHISRLIIPSLLSFHIIQGETIYIYIIRTGLH